MSALGSILTILSEDPEAAVLAFVTFATVSALALNLLAQLLRAVAVGLSAAKLGRAAAVSARIADGLLASGLHLKEFVKATKGQGSVANSLPPPKDDGPKSGGPKPPTLFLGVFLLATTTGCHGLIEAAVVSANAARDVGEIGSELLNQRCVSAYESARTLGEVDRIDSTCLPLRDAYRAHRATHLALVVAIQTAQAGGDVSALPKAIADAALAAELMAKALKGAE